MKSAGYYMVRLGIETAGEHAARGMELQKKFNIPRLKQLMTHGTSIGLKFYGTFTFGGEGSTYDCDRKTIDLIHDLIDKDLLWRFQLSISTPQPGTPFFNRMNAEGYLEDLDWKHFDGGNHCVVHRPDYPPEQVMKNFRDAEKLYEVGFNKRYSATAKDSFKSIPVNSSEDILVFRSTRMKQMNDVVGSIRSQFNRSKITVLGQPVIEKELKGNPNVNEILLYGDNHFNESTFPEALIQHLKKRSFSMGVIPFNNISGNGYAAVKSIAKKIGIRKLVAVNIEGKVFDLDNPGDHGRAHLC
jgi:hypothetical protein